MTNEENILLLGCLVRYDQLLVEAISKVGRHQLFDNLRDPCATFIWSVLRQCRQKAGAFPVRTMVEVEAYGRLQALTGLDATFQENIKAILANIYSIEDRYFSPEIGRFYLQQALESALSVGWYEQLRSIGTLEELRKYVNEVGNDLAGLSSDQQAMAKPLEDPGRFLVRRPRMPFGIRALDLISGGGLAPGEVMGLLGPTGGGKTVMAVGMACERARRAQHVQLYTYEQRTEGDVMERLCCYMTGLDIGRFRDKALVDLDPGASARLREESARYAKYLSVVDLAQGTRGSGGMDEVMSYIDIQAERGECPGLVIIDWLGSMVQRYLAFNNLQSDQYRHIGHQFIDKLSSHAKKLGYSAVINHQLRTDAARRRPEVKPNVAEAHEMRAFAYYLDACACLGTLSPDTFVGWLIMDKQRRGACGDVLVRLDGPHMKFEQAEGFVTDHRGRFISEASTAPDAEDEAESKKINEDYQEAYPEQ